MLLSHPYIGAGLSFAGFVAGAEVGVAPHAGAWIETFSSDGQVAKNRRVLVWARGLKLG